MRLSYQVSKLSNNGVGKVVKVNHWGIILLYRSLEEQARCRFDIVEETNIT